MSNVTQAKRCLRIRGIHDLETRQQALSVTCSSWSWSTMRSNISGGSLRERGIVVALHQPVPESGFDRTIPRELDSLTTHPQGRGPFGRRLVRETSLRRTLLSPPRLLPQLGRIYRQSISDLRSGSTRVFWSSSPILPDDYGHCDAD